MPGTIQSIERAAAVLGLLGSSAAPLALAEIADALDLARPTAHGILGTLVSVGFVHQDTASRHYVLGARWRGLQQHGVDRHDLRSQATSWCDSLASRTRMEVVVCVPTAAGAEVVHHVLRPDGTPPRLRLGDMLPLHATGVGKALLSAAVGLRGATGDLPRLTRRTVSTHARLRRDVERTREAGYGLGAGEHVPETGDVAAAVRGAGGLAVGAVACTGPLDELVVGDAAVRPAVRDAVMDTAAAVSHALGEPR